MKQPEPVPEFDRNEGCRTRQVKTDHGYREVTTIEPAPSHNTKYKRWGSRRFLFCSVFCPRLHNPIAKVWQGAAKRQHHIAGREAVSRPWGLVVIFISEDNQCTELRISLDSRWPLLVSCGRPSAYLTRQKIPPMVIIATRMGRKRASAPRTWWLDSVPTK